MTARPLENADALNVIVLGTTTSPGKVTITGHDRTENWDVQKAEGNVGATTKLKGADPGDFTCSFYLAGDGYGSDFEESNDFDQWETFQKLIDSLTSGSKPVALPIYHPALARQKFTEVTKAMVGGMTYDGLGGATVVVKFIEYRPPKPKPVVAATGKPGATEAPDPNAAAKLELGELVSQANQP
jgi:hypothetical protein